MRNKLRLSPEIYDYPSKTSKAPGLPMSREISVNASWLSSGIIACWSEQIKTWTGGRGSSSISNFENPAHSTYMVPPAHHGIASRPPMGRTKV